MAIVSGFGGGWRWYLYRCRQVARGGMGVVAGEGEGEGKCQWFGDHGCLRRCCKKGGRLFGLTALGLFAPACFQELIAAYCAFFAFDGGEVLRQFPGAAGEAFAQAARAYVAFDEVFAIPLVGGAAPAVADASHFLVAMQDAGFFVVEIQAVVVGFFDGFQVAADEGVEVAYVVGGKPAGAFAQVVRFVQRVESDDGVFAVDAALCIARATVVVVVFFAEVEVFVFADLVRGEQFFHGFKVGIVFFQFARGVLRWGDGFDNGQRGGGEYGVFVVAAFDEGGGGIHALLEVVHFQQDGVGANGGEPPLWFFRVFAEGDAAVFFLYGGEQRPGLCRVEAGAAIVLQGDVGDAFAVYLHFYLCRGAFRVGVKKAYGALHAFFFAGFAGELDGDGRVVAFVTLVASGAAGAAVVTDDLPVALFKVNAVQRKCGDGRGEEESEGFLFHGFSFFRVNGCREKVVGLGAGGRFAG